MIWKLSALRAMFRHRSVWHTTYVGVCLASSLATVSPVHAQRVAVHDATSQTAAADALLRKPVSVNLEQVPLTTAVDRVADAAGIVIAYQRERVARVRSLVTVHASGVPLGDVFAQVLAGTSLCLQPLPEGQFSIVACAGSLPAEGDGIIVGTVIDAVTKLPLAGVMISLDGATKGSVTSANGHYRLTHVAAGSHRMTARLLGYARQYHTVTVTEGGEITVDFALDPVTTTLDQVIVTGTVVPTERKAIPNAITVITAKQIEERGITRIDQLFRGDVPGLFAFGTQSSAPFDQVVMFSRGATALSLDSRDTYWQTNMIKTYVDGVEMVDPSLISQIDPASIERVEILAGPQASTVYGSGAINGVMQIFTKRGTSPRPQLSINLLSGLVQNDMSPALAPQHDFTAQLDGVEGRISYHLGSAWEYMSPWTPSRRFSRLSAFGGARIELPTQVGPVSGDISYRRGTGNNWRNGVSGQPTVHLIEEGWYRPVVVYDGWVRGEDTQTMQTGGVTLQFAPVSWWSHTAEYGLDESNSASRIEAGFNMPQDTSPWYQTLNSNRTTLRYGSTVRIPVASVSQATVTFGGDVTRMAATTVFGSVNPIDGFFGSTYLIRNSSRNKGAFVQAQWGFFDHLFLTYGLRSEWNPDYGAKENPNLAPRYGVALTHEFGMLTAKLRASYGRSTRPPTPQAKRGSDETAPERVLVYGKYEGLLANPLLRPEQQQGGEGGMELYLGQRASLVVTRYNQTVNDLITTINGIDSVRSLAPNPLFFGQPCSLYIGWGDHTTCSSQDANGYGYAWLRQNMNVGGIRNQGWELQGNVVTGPFTTRGVYSWTKSRSLGISTPLPPAYVSRFFTKGASFDYLPEHTWSVGVTYSQARATVALTATGAGQARVDRNDFYMSTLSENIRLQSNRPRIQIDDQNYTPMRAGYASSDLTASYRLTPSVDAALTVLNLGNYYAKDRTAELATIGRQSKVGLRMRF